MTLRDDLIPLVREIRGIPGELGIRPHRVFLRTKTGAAAFGASSILDEEEIVEGGGHPPKVRELDGEQLALSGLDKGSLEIGPITVPCVSLGVTADQLSGADLDAYESLHVRVVGPMGDNLYRIKAAKMDRALHWMLTVSPLAENAD